jgi:uncharacterized membrane protein
MTAAIALFLFGVLTAALSLQLPIGNLRAPGSGFFPFALGLVLMALAAGQAIQLLLAKPKPAPAAEGSGATRRVALFMGAVVLATALLKPLGYAPVAFLLMLALLQTLGVRKWHVSGLIALLSAAASHVVFVVWLKIPLPAAGWLGF